MAASSKTSTGREPHVRHYPLHDLPVDIHHYHYRPLTARDVMAHQLMEAYLTHRAPPEPDALLAKKKKRPASYSGARHHHRRHSPPRGRVSGQDERKQPPKKKEHETTVPMTPRVFLGLPTEEGFNAIGSQSGSLRRSLELMRRRSVSESAYEDLEKRSLPQLNTLLAKAGMKAKANGVELGVPTAETLWPVWPGTRHVVHIPILHSLAPRERSTVRERWVLRAVDTDFWRARQAAPSQIESTVAALKAAGDYFSALNSGDYYSAISGGGSFPGVFGRRAGHNAGGDPRSATGLVFPTDLTVGDLIVDMLQRHVLESGDHASAAWFRAYSTAFMPTVNGVGPEASHLMSRRRKHRAAMPKRLIEHLRAFHPHVMASQRFQVWGGQVPNRLRTLMSTAALHYMDPPADLPRAAGEGGAERYGFEDVVGWAANSGDGAASAVELWGAPIPPRRFRKSGYGWLLEDAGIVERRYLVKSYRLADFEEERKEAAKKAEKEAAKKSEDQGDSNTSWHAVCWVADDDGNRGRTRTREEDKNRQAKELPHLDRLLPNRTLPARHQSMPAPGEWTTAILGDLWCQDDPPHTLDLHYRPLKLSELTRRLRRRSLSRSHIVDMFCVYEDGRSFGSSVSGNRRHAATEAAQPDKASEAIEKKGNDDSNGNAPTMTKKGHRRRRKRRNPPDPRNGPPLYRREVRCHNCASSRHGTAKCPMFCGHCNGTSHRAEECPFDKKIRCKCGPFPLWHLARSCGVPCSRRCIDDFGPSPFVEKTVDGSQARPSEDDDDDDDDDDDESDKFEEALEHQEEENEDVEEDVNDEDVPLDPDDDDEWEDASDTSSASTARPTNAEPEPKAPPRLTKTQRAARAAQFPHRVAMLCRLRCCMCGLRDGHCGRDCALTRCRCGGRHLGQDCTATWKVECPKRGCPRYLCTIHCRSCGADRFLRGEGEESNVDGVACPVTRPRGRRGRRGKGPGAAVPKAPGDDGKGADGSHGSEADTSRTRNWAVEGWRCPDCGGPPRAPRPPKPERQRRPKPPPSVFGPTPTETRDLKAEMEAYLRERAKLIKGRPTTIL